MAAVSKPPIWCTDSPSACAWVTSAATACPVSYQAQDRLLQADCGLSLPEYEVLVQLSEAPRGKLRPFQLGLALDWEQSRLSHMLSRMSRRGFVVRQDCAGDRRGAEVALTAAGRAAIESAAPGHVAAVRRLVFDQMDSEQAAAFGQVFEAILAGLGNSGPR
jgi:DNA-binding MarR family transcriptional regulator